nr:MAG TPA: hypothetical protein [Caudoviricetes sp.]
MYGPLPYVVGRCPVVYMTAGPFFMILSIDGEVIWVGFFFLV